MNVPACPLHGVTVNALEAHNLVALIREVASRHERYVAAIHNLHSLYLYHHNPLLRRFYEHADYVHVDEMLLIWAGKLLRYPLGREHRPTSLDWLPPRWNAAPRRASASFS